MNERAWREHMAETETKDLVKTQVGGQFMTLDEDLLKMGGMGTEKVSAKDILIPRLTILQALSPQLSKKKAEYIDGAEIGDFCNVATGDIYKGSVLVIPCYFVTHYIEWGKGRSGIVHNYGDDSSVIKKTSKNEKFQNILQNGNSIAETAQWYCLLQDGANWTRVFFPLTSTNLKHSKKWMTLCRIENVTQANGVVWKPPLFWRSWKLTAIEDSNDQGDWTTFRPERGESALEIDPSRRLLKECMSFYEDVKTEAVRGEIIDEDQGRTVDGIVNKEEPF
jgi:hypothetical protein